MPEDSELKEQILKIRSSCVLTSWIITSMNEGAVPEETEHLKYELTEGINSLLENVSGELDEIYKRLEEKTN
ncbi:hypothetical protein K7I13_11410 [Brucepastera parasyntrophica]|uniref:hypothetical protein n=1 Tax=Brucepastera parasyntrophica TaxID=2880008 RepID=UPI00210D5266|nr:hypothetical protein [Brucepastera parasyntrophica]ULQ59097.1 hypothetical protein K7I13_11345 [Brucepastera parasyntrophica]ULQ59108.1 hypothetical protein K7I13_11410 [Brucepastera parasyntrophica]